MWESEQLDMKFKPRTAIMVKKFKLGPPFEIGTKEKARASDVNIDVEYYKAEMMLSDANTMSVLWSLFTETIEYQKNAGRAKYAKNDMAMGNAQP